MMHRPDLTGECQRIGKSTLSPHLESIFGSAMKGAQNVNIFWQINCLFHFFFQNLSGRQTKRIRLEFAQAPNNVQRWVVSSEFFAVNKIDIQKPLLTMEYCEKLYLSRQEFSIARIHNRDKSWRFADSGADKIAKDMQLHVQSKFCSTSSTKKSSVRIRNTNR